KPTNCARRIPKLLAEVRQISFLSNSNPGRDKGDDLVLRGYHDLDEARAFIGDSLPQHRLDIRFRGDTCRAETETLRDLHIIDGAEFRGPGHIDIVEQHRLAADPSVGVVAGEDNRDVLAAATDGFEISK